MIGLSIKLANKLTSLTLLTTKHPVNYLAKLWGFLGEWSPFAWTLSSLCPVDHCASCWSASSVLDLKPWPQLWKSGHALFPLKILKIKFLGLFSEVSASDISANGQSQPFYINVFISPGSCSSLSWPLRIIFLESLLWTIHLGFVLHGHSFKSPCMYIVFHISVSNLTVTPQAGQGKHDHFLFTKKSHLCASHDTANHW